VVDLRQATGTPGAPSAPPSTPVTLSTPVTVGRDQELRRIAAAVTDPAGAGIVVTGAAGTGRSRLAEAATAAARAGGRPVTWVRLSQPHSGDAQLGTLRALHAVPDPALPGDDATAVPAKRRDTRPLICVDDAHLLEDTAAARLHELAATGAATLLLTVAAHHTMPPALVALWKDGVCDRLDLGPLDRAASDDLVRALLGVPADSDTASRLWALTRGVPRYVVELVRGGLQSGALDEVSGIRVWRGRMDVPPRLVELVEADLAALEEDQRAALELAAAAAPAGPELLARAGADVRLLESLERARVLTAVRSGRRLLLDVADPVVAEVVRQQTGSLRARGINRRLAAALSASGGRRRDDVLRLASARLAGGEEPAGVPALEAARQALRRLDLPLAERLARGAAASGAGQGAVGALAQALVLQGRTHEAEALLQRAVGTRGGTDGPTGADGTVSTMSTGSTLSTDGTVSTGGGTDEVGRNELLALRVANLRWGLGRRAAATRLLARAEQPHRVLRARVHLWDGAYRAAWREAQLAMAAEPVARGRPHDALMAAVPARCALGRTTAAIDMVTDDRWAEQGGPVVEELAFWLCQAHLVHGSFDGAERIARDGRDRGTGGRLPLLAAWWATQLGTVALARGRCGTAESLFREALALVSTTRGAGVHRPLVLVTALRGLARAHALLGDHDAAASALDEAARATVPGFEVVLLWGPSAAARVAAARGHTPRAITLATSHAARARRAAAPGLELQALHELVTLGRARQVLDRVRTLAEQVDGPLPRLRVDHTEAAAASDAAGLEAVATRYLGLGADLAAAETAAQAARLHAAAGRDPAARRATSAAMAALERCEGASTPVTALLGEPPGLTERQREIAALAVQGMPSKAIARHLVLSVRTVDNCLGQVYRKLGISRRSELAPALGIQVRAVEARPGVGLRTGNARPATG
jgi:DNA-binding CsgD family transcriptional regulator